MSPLARLALVVDDFPSESRLVGLGRTIIALAQASVLALTPAAYLFVPVGADTVRVDCRGFPEQLSAYCLTGPGSRQLVSWVLVALLLVVASGLLPRLTAVVHFWVSLSLHSSLSLPDGGEAAAQVATFFLVLVCLDDRRTWHWQSPRPRRPGTAARGVAWAGLWGLRLQVSYLYLNSAVTKTSVAPWQDGTATYYVSRMENFGAAGLLADAVLWATALPLVAVATSWGAMAAEAAVAVLVLGRGVRQAAALALSAALHLMIILQLGIASFGLIMIGAVVCATSRGVGETVPRLLPRAARALGSGVRDTAGAGAPVAVPTPRAS